MQREYLEEDLRLIQSYFPGAHAVVLRTPFDLTARPQARPQQTPDMFRETAAPANWFKDVLWTN